MIFAFEGRVFKAVKQYEGGTPIIRLLSKRGQGAGGEMPCRKRGRNTGASLTRKNWKEGSHGDEAANYVLEINGRAAEWETI